MNHHQNDEQFMTVALDACRRGIQAGQTPFGACIVRGDQVICADHNQVWANTDITAHAEIQAIRHTCNKLQTIDLSGCVIYSTTEPCPMCFGAIHWAKFDRVVYATTISDAAAFGFSELHISNHQMKDLGGSSVQVIGHCLSDQSLELLKLWSAKKDRNPY